MNHDLFTLEHGYNRGAVCQAVTVKIVTEKEFEALGGASDGKRGEYTQFTFQFPYKRQDELATGEANGFAMGFILPDQYARSTAPKAAAMMGETAADVERFINLSIQ